MKNKRKIVLLAIMMLFGLGLAGQVLKQEAKAAETADLKIHAIDLGSDAVKGDAVLVESQGQFLLIDTGDKDSSRQVINYLKGQGVKNLSIYISHFHSDHIGELVDIMESGAFTVENLYVGERSILSRAVDAAAGDPEVSAAEKTRLNATLEKYDGLKRKAGKKTYERNFVEVKAGHSFKVGAATVDTLGVPDFSLSDFSNDSAKDATLTETKLEHYMNNMSLCTMITVPSGGKSVKYLTCGDAEAETEKWLLSKGISLKCDILKLNHHGTDTSNGKKFLQAAAAGHAFSNHYVNAAEIKRQNAIYKNYKLNKTETKATAEKNLYGLIRTQIPMQTAEKYGEVYRTQFNGNIVYSVADGAVTVSSPSGFRTQNGKTYLYWKDGLVKGDSKGYITGYNGSLFKADAAGALTPGFYTYKGKKYYCYGAHNMAVIDYGFYKVGTNSYYSGPYTAEAATGWKMINNKRYYFDTKTAVMAKNCVKKVSGSYIYFDKKGLQYSGKGWITVGKDKYYITDGAKGTGKVFTKGWLKIGTKKYFFKADGKLKK